LGFFLTSIISSRNFDVLDIVLVIVSLNCFINEKLNLEIGDVMVFLAQVMIRIGLFGLWILGWPRTVAKSSIEVSSYFVV
jgi:hypothetical protein